MVMFRWSCSELCHGFGAQPGCETPQPRCEPSPPKARAKSGKAGGAGPVFGREEAGRLAEAHAQRARPRRSADDDGVGLDDQRDEHPLREDIEAPLRVHALPVGGEGEEGDHPLGAAHVPSPLAAGDERLVLVQDVGEVALDRVGAVGAGEQPARAPRR